MGGGWKGDDTTLWAESCMLVEMRMDTVRNVCALYCVGGCVGGKCLGVKVVPLSPCPPVHDDHKTQQHSVTSELSRRLHGAGVRNNCVEQNLLTGTCPPLPATTLHSASTTEKCCCADTAALRAVSAGFHCSYVRLLVDRSTV